LTKPLTIQDGAFLVYKYGRLVTLESAKEHPVNSEENRTGELPYASACLSDRQSTKSIETAKSKDKVQGSQAVAA
jgi:hypothetical protein